MIWYLIISINIVMVLCAIFRFMQCRNPAYGWNKTIVTEYWPVEIFANYAVFSGAYSGLCDFVFGKSPQSMLNVAISDRHPAIYPWVVLRQLSMRKREKAAVGLQ